MYLKPVCHTVCKSIYTHERSGQGKRSKIAATSVKVLISKVVVSLVGKIEIRKGS